MFDITVLGYEDTPTKKRMRKTILNTAFQLAIKRGFANVQIEEFLETAKISRGTLYNYYPSFQAITIDVEIVCMEKLKNAKVNSENGLNGLIQVTNMLKSYGKWFNKNKEVITFMTMFDYAYVENYENPSLSNYLNQNNLGHLLYPAIKRGIEDGSIIQKDPSMLAYTLAQTGFAYIQKFIFHQMVTTFDDITDQIGDYDLFVELLINSIRKC